MPSGSPGLDAPVDLDCIEVWVKVNAYLLCAFAAFAGIFVGYDSSYINGVIGSKMFIQLVQGAGQTSLSSSNTSLITSVPSVGTFFGALISSDVADWYGRRPPIIAGCCIYFVGCALQTASSGLALFVAGRVVAGVGTGFTAATIVLYISEVSPKKVRGSLFSFHHFCMTIGILLASCVTYATESRTDTGSYRIPISIQLIWGLALAISICFLPESPRYFVKKDKINKARAALSRLRGQREDSKYVTSELAEIVANAEYEKKMIPITGYWSSWFRCFTGSLWKGSSNIRRIILGMSFQMMQQWTGYNFIFHYSTPFLKSTGAISNSFFISLIFALVNVLSAPISLWTIEKLGRRPLVVWSAFGMVIWQFLVAIIGVTVGFDKTHIVAGTVVANNIPAVNAQIVFIAIYIFFSSSMWSPGIEAITSEIFPLPIRARGIALSAISNRLSSTVIVVITPYMVNPDAGNLRSSVFFIWGSLCACTFFFAYFLIPETKGLTLEQIDRMLEETTPRTSARWVPRTTNESEEYAKEINVE